MDTRETLVDMRDEIMRMHGHDLNPVGEGKIAALTAAIAALDKVAEYEEMMQEADAITFKSRPTILRLLGGKWGTRTGEGYQDVYYLGGPLEAFKAIKEQK